MARYTVITFQCPRCKTDLARRFGLITSRSTPCPGCGTTVHVDAQVVGQNWAWNFGWVAFLITWVALGAGILLDPHFAASIGGTAFKTDTREQRGILAGVCAIPAFLAALVVGGIGMVLGGILVTEEKAPRSALPPALPAGLPGTLPTTLATPQSRRRSWFIRIPFILFWPVFVFIAGAIVMTAASGSLSAESKEVAEQLNKQSAEKYAMWVFLASVVTFLLGCFGVMPWTGSGKKKAAPPPPAPDLDAGIFRP